MNGGVDELVANVVAVNFSGRFKGQEVKNLGQAFLHQVVAAKNFGLVFGQQVSFRMTSLPANMELIGGQRAFILYNRSVFEANDDLQYRHFLRELEMKGRLARHFLPDANYSLCKLKSKRMRNVAMIAMSWMTDETNDKLRSLNLLRKLLSYAADLCAVELLPVVIAGSFRLSLDDIKEVVYNEFEGFCCYGYRAEKPRRAQRQCNVYISCPPLYLDDVMPVVCGKIKVPDNTNHRINSWRNPEDAFYWDPVFAAMIRHYDASSVMSPVTSPRPLTPPISQSALHATWPTDSEPNEQVTGESAEDTLRVLLIESDRIKEMVSEAESRARSWLQAKSQVPQPAVETQSDAKEKPRQTFDFDDEAVKKFWQKVTCEHNKSVLTSGESNEKLEQSGYVDLYDEQLIANNTRCYMQ